jgi:hypothetical protein
VPDGPLAIPSQQREERPRTRIVNQLTHEPCDLVLAERQALDE